ncbi:MAG: SDR family NAD(P)-dependent oxidoreductase [Pseudomonadota bacterium]|nr:SDR family NAD(P)-dependent oxidoreductase [Pseudomonadota bacterium]
MSEATAGDGRLAGKVALITGAADGIGRAITEQFSAEGAAVAVTDINGKGAEAVAARIRATGRQAMAIACDVSESGAVQHAVEHCVSNFGCLTTVVGGAAVLTPVVPIDALSEDDWQRALDVNLTGCFLLCKHAVPHLKAAQGSSIILIASQMARVASEGQAAYCATKGALTQLAKTMALDYAADLIRVNTRSPGGVATGRLAKRFGSLEQAQRIWGPKHPLGRLGEPEEVARSAVFLASEDSSFMTGSDLLIDGGYSAW